MHGDPEAHRGTLSDEGELAAWERTPKHSGGPQSVPGTAEHIAGTPKHAGDLRA